MAPSDRLRRPLVVYADGPDAPLVDPATVAAIQQLGEPEILLGWTVRPVAWVEQGRYAVTTTMTGAGLRSAVGAGRVRAAHVRLSAMPGLLSGWMRPDVAVVGAVADGRGWRSIGSVGWAPAAASAARQVVIERWPAWPPGADRPPRTPPIEGNVVEVVERSDPPDPVQTVTAGDAEARIAGRVAALLPEGAALQWGPGSIGAAVVAALERPVRVRSGLVTDELVGLWERGLLDGVAESAYAWGGAGLHELLGAGRLRLASVEVTHDLTALSSDPRLVAVNAALEVGLDGSVNVETSGGRVVSGPGGHPDFCLAASRSPGGLSIIVARSSAIVARAAIVSTPRTDVDVVVTEHGVADLRGGDDRARASALADVAAPERRSSLVDELDSISRARR